MSQYRAPLSPNQKCEKFWTLALVKCKNLAAPAVKREAEKDWGKEEVALEKCRLRRARR